jgi:PAS domain S-box-containing protein
MVRDDTPLASEIKTSATAPLLLAGFILLAFVVLLSIIFSNRERTTNADVQTILTTENDLADTLSTVRQTENGLRGYLLTGNAVSLQTYNLAVRHTPQAVAALDADLAGTPEADFLPRLHALVTTKQTELNETMALINAGERAAATGHIDDDLRVGTMLDLRNLITAITARQDARLAALEAAADRASWFLQAATFLAIFGTLLLATIVIRANRQQTEKLLAAEAALRHANAALEQKVAQRTANLAISEARFRLLSESIPSLVYMTDAQGNTVHVNPQTVAYSGVPQAAHLGYNWTSIIHPDDLERCLSRWDESLASATPYETEFRIRRHDGAYRWFLDRATPLRDPEGVITAWIGTSTDIHDRKMAEAAMADENAALEQRVAARTAELDRIFTLSTDILAVGDFAGRLLAVSPAWERITGLPLSDVLNGPFIDFVHPEDMARTQAAFDQLVAGEPAAVQNRFRHADGSWRWLSWRAVTQPEERLIYAVARDITAERERDEQLRQSQKMEVVGQLTGGVAHDFNNLLTIIMGSLELLQKSLGEAADPRQSRRVDNALEASRRAASLTHRLLAFSRRSPLAPKNLDVNRLLAGMSDMLSRTLGETVALQFISGAALWPALADANQLENAILNLAVNARDALTGSSGKLLIETQNIFLDENYVKSNVDVIPGPYVMIAVSDTGCGMTSEIRDKVFEPFFTTKPQGQGTGLGLAQVYGFIKQSGGHVSLYSEPGEGTVVKLYLPRMRGTASEETLPPTPASALRRPDRNETILVVEDEPGVRDFSVEVLADLGYTVLAAETAAQAFMIFAATPAIRLVFTDVVLTGGKSGRELADELRQLRPHTIILFTTGYTRNAIIHQGRLDEGINFLGKPFTAAALAEKIATLLESVPTPAE